VQPRRRPGCRLSPLGRAVRVFETPRKEPHAMTTDPKDLELGLYIFILAGFLGFHVISRVPPLLHTPLMSATNAISGISLIGSLVVAGGGHDLLTTFLGFLAVCCSSTNVVGGFLITDRMLKMFKSEREGGAERKLVTVELALVALVIVLGGILAVLWASGQLQHIPPHSVLTFLYILSSVLFILG